MEHLPPNVQDRIKAAIDNLPTLPPGSFPPEESCPICLLSFSSILSDQGIPHSKILAEGGDPISSLASSSSQSDRNEYLGITKLTGCGHIFCKRDVVEWIQNQHGSCPACRNIFLDVKFPSDSDNESSDGGEYLPGIEDDDEEEEDFFDGGDGLEFDVEEMDLDLDSDVDQSFDHEFLSEAEEDVDDECWLTDGSTLSDLDLASGPEEDIEVREPGATTDDNKTVVEEPK